MGVKSFIFGLLLFALGLTLGMYSATLRSVGNSPFDFTARDKLQALASSDLEDYYRLKTMEEKYRKADEILGKIMAIFLADLGLHISSHAQSTAKEPLPWTDPRPGTSPSHVSAPSPAPPLSEVAKPPKAAVWTSGESALLSTREDIDVPALLRKVLIDDFDAAIKTTQPFHNRNDVLTSINGNFEGPTTVSAGGVVKQWYVHVETAGAMQKGSMRGSLKIRMLENGKVFNNSSNTGDITAFQEFVGDSNAVVAKASPSIYFQLYYLKELDQLAGHIYQREAEQTGFIHLGTLNLKRAR